MLLFLFVVITMSAKKLYHGNLHTVNLRKNILALRQNFFELFRKNSIDVT